MESTRDNFIEKRQRYLEIYKDALKKYVAQEQRTHYSLKDKSVNRVYPFGILNSLFHSAKEYKELQQLRAILESDDSLNQEKSVQAIIQHFSNKKNKWNLYSFNCYLLDEIQKNVSTDEWIKNWERFDKYKIVYYRGMLFRGSGSTHTQAFLNGLIEVSTSNSIEDYINDMNGTIGVSSTKSFKIAKGYALPTINPMKEWQQVWSESYIYIIDYQGDHAIDLAETFRARGNSFSASLSENKKEVNVIGKIEPKHIIGAFFINRRDMIVWHKNEHYQGEYKNLIDSLKDQLPSNFYEKLLLAKHNSTFKM